MNVDTQWVKDNAGVGEALRDVNLLDSEQDCAFMMGAQWHAAGMAVCEFLSDLAAQVNACRHCLGSGQVYGGRGCSVIEACPTCKGTGKRVTP